jgi:hydrogenase/urease accessory protein HupE
MSLRRLTLPLLVLCACLASVPPACAHRLDEYLQATILSVGRDRIEVSMRLVPGVAVSSKILAGIDTNADGVISDTERHAYAERVLRDLSLSVDGHVLKPQLVSVDFPTIEEMREGLGEIKIEFAADLAPGSSARKIVFENHHQRPISAYLVNCLAPRDPDIQIVAQIRNANQSFYALEYTQVGGQSNALPAQWWAQLRAWLGNLGGFPSMFRLGMRHIAEGTDHLLFLLALLLPAPLLAFRSRWAGFAGVRHSILQILKVVTAFTIGHSITLALAALGLVRVPSRPIEILIAFSILVSAAHALRPLFPGREALIAAVFGLLHGLAFGQTLQNLGLGWWERVAGILGFNLGIETMQLIVISAAMPSFVLLSRTRAYSPFRIGGALFAIFASAGWMAERLFNLHNPVDPVVDSIAHRALWIAPILLLISVVCWALSNVPDKQLAPPSHYPDPVEIDC